MPPKINFKNMDFDNLLGRGPGGSRRKTGLNKLKKDAPDGPTPRVWGQTAAEFALGWGGLGGHLRAAADYFLPKYMSKVTVAITGSPRSNMNDLYFLALSTAFGATKNITYASDSTINIGIDRTGKKVVVELLYETSAVAAVVNIVDGSFRPNAGKQAIQAGVPASVSGADWPDFLRFARDNKELPYVDRVIATEDAAVNYVPYQDGMSRDNDLYQIIQAALLQGPCTKPGLPYTTKDGIPETKPVNPFPGTTTIESVPSLNSSSPTTGGLDTNRWNTLANVAVAGGIPQWIDPPDYSSTGTSSLRNN